jgi:TIR domain
MTALESVLEIAAGVVGSILVSAGLSYVQDSLRRGPSRLRLAVGGEQLTVDPEDVEESLERISRTIETLRRHPRVFIATAEEDAEFARKLAMDLREHGVLPWLGLDEIQVGDSIPERIQEGMEGSQWVVVVLSPSVKDSPWVEREIRAATRSEKKRGRRLILPVLETGDFVPPVLQNRAFADFRRDYREGLEELLRAIQPEPARS